MIAAVQCSPSTVLPTANSQPLNVDRPLVAYFRSGWAFLIPYLAVYLLYAWLKWPVNPELVGAGSMEQGARGWVPCLLHVYWALHVIHIALGAIALRSRWRTSGPTDNGRDALNRPQVTAHRSLEIVYRLIPWLCLALIFWIPGIYLEWPSDPWEHLRRINEWHILDEVSAHSSWEKSSYFLPFSLTGFTAGLTQLTWLNFYYISICLLLSWQYYRLARAVGLGERASFVFVLLNALTFGNNIFSFYRYYGLSSSIFAQLFAVALIRIAIEPARIKCEEPEQKRDLVANTRPYFSLNRIFRRASEAIPRPPPLSASHILSLNSSIGALLVLIYFSHFQGLAIALLGLAAVLGWWFSARDGSKCLWLALGAIIIGYATILWGASILPEALNYRDRGWLNAWFGFNLLQLDSPAFSRAGVIVGIVGLANLLAGLLLLLKRNHIVGWLTVTPVLILLHPTFSMILVHMLNHRGAGDILVFHRLLFAVPSGLALVTMYELWWKHHDAQEDKTIPKPGSRGGRKYFLCYVLLLSVSAAAVLLPPKGAWANRFWHLLMSVPTDVTLSAPLQGAAAFASQPASDPETIVLGTTGGAFLFKTAANLNTLLDPFLPYRTYQFPNPRSPAMDLEAALTALNTGPRFEHGILPVIRTDFVTSPWSLAALLSAHWLPQEASLALSGTKEITCQAAKIGMGPVFTGDALRIHSNLSRSGQITPALVPHHLEPSRSGLIDSTLFTGNFASKPTMRHGNFSAQVSLRPNGQPWSNLLAMNTNQEEGAIHLRIWNETGDVYITFFGHDSGPFHWPADHLTSSATLEFIWRDRHQRLSINGQEIGLTRFPVPIGATARQVFVGWFRLQDVESWHGDLTVEKLLIGQSE